MRSRDFRDGKRIPGLDAIGCIVRNAASDADVDEILEFVELENTGSHLFQVFSYDAIIGEAHLKAAYVNTLLAFGGKSNIAKSRHIEMLLFAAMTRQIGDAIHTVGIKSTRRFIAFSDNAKAMQNFRKVAKLGVFATDAEHSREAARRLGFGGRIPDKHEILSAMAQSRLGV